MDGFKSQHFGDLRDGDVGFHQFDGLFEANALVISAQRDTHFGRKNLRDVGVTVSHVAADVLHTVELKNVALHVVDDVVDQAVFSAGVLADFLAQAVSAPKISLGQEQNQVQIVVDHVFLIGTIQDDFVEQADEIGRDGVLIHGDGEGMTMELLIQSLVFFVVRVFGVKGKPQIIKPDGAGVAGGDGMDEAVGRQKQVTAFHLVILTVQVENSAAGNDVGNFVASLLMQPDLMVAVAVNIADLKYLNAAELSGSIKIDIVKV